MNATVATQPKCSANATGRAATEWGEHALPCQVRSGLRVFTDRAGVTRWFCGSLGHEANARRRFGEQTETQRVSAAIERISADFAAELDEDVDEEAAFLREGLPEFSGQFR